MRTPRIRNGYPHFGGKIKRRKTKRKRGTKRRRPKGGAFFGPMHMHAVRRKNQRGGIIFSHILNAGKRVLATIF